MAPDLFCYLKKELLNEYSTNHKARKRITYKCKILPSSITIIMNTIQTYKVDKKNNLKIQV